MLTLTPKADALDCLGVLHLAEHAVLAGMLTVPQIMLLPN